MKAIIHSPLVNPAIEDLRSSLGLESQEDLHLTWFALELDDEKKEMLLQAINNVSQRFLPIETISEGITTTSYGVTRIAIAKTKQIQDLHEAIVKASIEFRNPDLPSKTMNFYDTMPSKEKQMVDKYGRPNVMAHYCPHVSLGRTKIILELDTKHNIFLSDVGIRFS